MRRGASRLMRRDTPSAVVVLWTVHCWGVYDDDGGPLSSFPTA